MWFAERRHVQLERAGVHRDEHDLTLRDGLVIGLVQCLSLIPGVSRSGATISAGLLQGVNRVTATELSFFMAIPALTAAGVFQALDQRHNLGELGFGQMALGIVVAFVVAYASIAWLLRYVANHSIMVFVWYRVALGLLLAGLLATGVISATCPADRGERLEPAGAAERAVERQARDEHDRQHGGVAPHM